MIELTIGLWVLCGIASILLGYQTIRENGSDITLLHCFLAIFVIASGPPGLFIVTLVWLLVVGSRIVIVKGKENE